MISEKAVFQIKSWQQLGLKNDITALQTKGYSHSHSQKDIRIPERLSASLAIKVGAIFPYF